MLLVVIVGLFLGAFGFGCFLAVCILVGKTVQALRQGWREGRAAPRRRLRS